MIADTFKNTFFGDILEYFNVLTFNEQIPHTHTGIDIEKLHCTVSHNSLDSQGSSSCEQKSTKFTGEIDHITDPYLVTWNGDDDPDHPYNFSSARKYFIIVQIMLYSCICYMGASIYTPGQEQIQKDFHVGHVTATLNLSIYVLGYGIGPVIFSPLSEVAKIGRQQIYVVTFLLFTVFQIGCATVQNIGGLIVLRFFAGIFCSPALSTAGATVADVIEGERLPPFTALWAASTVLSPVLAPLLGACMVVAKGWRWIFWLMFFLSIACFVDFFFFFQETSHSNILSRRARRLRKITGNDKYYTEQERIDSQVATKEFLVNTLYRPIKMMVKEPIILAFDLYISLAYGALYLFFEAFPLVFIGIYNFTLIEMGVAYMGFFVGCIIAFCILLLFLRKIIDPSHKNNTFKPELFLILVMCVSWCFPLSLFLFGWAAGTHWIVPIIAEAIFIIACFNLFQATFAYFANGYPNHVASAYAGNGFMRSIFACAFPLFGTAMYNNLAIDGYPVAWGSSLVGFITVVLALLPFVLYKYGPALRAKSSFTD